MTCRVLALTIAVFTVFPASAARRPGDPLRPGWNLFSRVQDVQLGEEAAQEVLKSSQVAQNQFLQDYVTRVGDRLAAQPDARNSGFAFHFTVLNDARVNAFALPGGPMFIYTGLVKAVANEAQLAGIMGHEMSHVILRHGTNQASKQAFISIPAALAGESKDDSMLGRLARIGIGIGTNSYLLHFSRNDESEADALGSHLMAEAGYEPLELARFFEKLQGSGGILPSHLASLLSDHPDPGNRREAITAEVSTLPRHAYGYQSGDFAKLKPAVASLPAPPPALPPAPDLTPASEYRQVTARSFNVQSPINWTAYGENDSDALTIAPQGGIVKGSNKENLVAVGAILSYSPPAEVTGDLKRDTTDLTQHLHGQNASLHVTRAPIDLRVAGKPALLTEMTSPSPFGGDESDIVLTVETPRGLFYAVFIAPRAKLDLMQPVFERMQRTIRFAP